MIARLLCALFGHDWRPCAPGAIVRGEWEGTVVCSRCDTWGWQKAGGR